MPMLPLRVNGGDGDAYGCYGGSGDVGVPSPSRPCFFSLATFTEGCLILPIFLPC